MKYSKKRFEMVMAHVESIVSLVEFEEKDRTVVVDTGDLEGVAAYYSITLDKLLKIPATEQNKDKLASALAMAWAAADSMKHRAGDTAETLQKLSHALCGDDEDEDS